MATAHNTNRTDNMSSDPRAGGLNWLVFWGLLTVGVLIAAVFVIRYPNLLGSPDNLALTTLTPIAIALALGIQFSGLTRRLPGLTVIGVHVVAAGLAALTLVVYAGPLFIGGGVGQDGAPAFVSTATAAPPTAATATTAPAPTTLTGAFDARKAVDTVSGNVTLGKTSDGKVILRFENLNSANGPDLHVYLSKEASPATPQQVMNGIEVGKLKATQGASNYELAATTDITEYKSVVVYCKTYSVVFGYANLS
jgi:hypothetical protein